MNYLCCCKCKEVRQLVSVSCISFDDANIWIGILDIVYCQTRRAFRKLKPKRTAAWNRCSKHISYLNFCLHSCVKITFSWSHLTEKNRINTSCWKISSRPAQQYLLHWTGPVVSGHIAGLTNLGFDSAIYRLSIVEWGDLPDGWLRTGRRWGSGIRV